MISVNRKRFLLLGSTAAAVLLLALAYRVERRAGGPDLCVFTGATMGTTFVVKVLAEPAIEDLNALGLAIQAAVDDVDAKMSTYKPVSELSRFNRHRSEEPFPVSPETAEVFRIALEISRQSGGAFDVTVGPLVNAWGFGPDARPATPPDDEMLARLRESVGYQHLAIDEQNRLIKKNPDLYCDLSGVAKGYATDRAAQAIEKHGGMNYMVEVGGEIRVRGHNATGTPWRIAIEKPVTGSGRDSYQQVLSLEETALATSGDYRNYYVENGQRLSHTIDPRTGRPIAHGLASVSVLHPACAWADAYATAIMALGPEDGYAFALEHKITALLIIHDGDAFITKAAPAFPQASS